MAKAPRKKETDYIRKTWPRVSAKKKSGVWGWRIDARKMREGQEVGKGDLWRADKAEALELAGTIAADYDDSGAQGVAMPIELRAQAFQAQKIMEPLGRSIVEACEFFRKHLLAEQAKRDSALISVLAPRWAEEMEADTTITRTGETMRCIKQFSKRIARVFGPKRSLDVEEKDMLDFLATQNVAIQTKRNINAYFSQFFAWCVAKGNMAKNPCENITVVVPRKDVTIFQPAKAEALLRLCEKDYPDYVFYFAICLFAGLRPEEAYALQWEQVNLEESEIFVLAHTSKTKESRPVPIEDTLYEWLIAYMPKDAKGYVTPQQNFDNVALRIHIAIGYRGTEVTQKNGEIKRTVVNPTSPTWPQDICRHCYGSYWLALHKNRTQLAENMGNSLKIIKKHYKRAVGKVATVAYWDILPKDVAEKRKAVREAEWRPDTEETGTVSEPEKAELRAEMWDDVVVGETFGEDED